MKIHLMSDMHCEFSSDSNHQYVLDEAPGTVLVLAGDIGYPAHSSTYEKLLTKASKGYNKVFIITGNHEYYMKKGRMSMKDMDDYIRNMTQKFSNVHFLQCDSFIYNRVRFLGCTFWSPGNPRLKYRMNDYDHIPGFTSEVNAKLHSEHTQWLTEQLDEISNEYDTTVVITHHMPSYDLIHNQYVGDPINVFFASHSDELVKKADYWLCGHTHKACHDFQIGKCKCYINPIGYPGESSGFNSKLFIEF